MNPPSQNESFFTKLHRRVFASRFLTFSLLLHIILLIMGGGVIWVQTSPELPDITGTIGEEMQIAPPPEEEPSGSPSDEPFAPAITISMPTITTEALSPRSTISVPNVAVPHVVGKTTLTDAVFTPRVPGTGETKFPPMMAHRSPEIRGKMLMKMGGTKESERAVARGLRWLADHQNADGSWSTDEKPAMTGLALLAFLGRGETALTPEFGANVSRGIDWLLARGTEFDARFSLTKDNWGGNDGVYHHAIATYALAEYYAITKDERAEELLRRAIGYIVGGQAPDGGWQYQYAKGPDSDTSVSGWQIQALKVAHLTGLNMAGVDDALVRSMGNLARVQGEKGGFGYRKPEDRYSLTGVGVLGTILWKQHKDKVVSKGVRFLLDSENPRVDYKAESADLYAWYYSTQACVLVGGPHWTRWNGMFRDQIVGNQSPDGSWPPVAGKSPGGELQRKPDGAGPFYRTTLCVLMLESYYRNVLGQ